MWKIYRSVIETFLQASQHTYPNEFAALLGGNQEKKIADELVIVPTIFGEEHAILQTHSLPLNDRVIGSVHSHPGFDNQPSEADLELFSSAGPLNLIVCEPYSVSRIAAYSPNGKKIGFEIISAQQAIP